MGEERMDYANEAVEHVDSDRRAASTSTDAASAANLVGNEPTVGERRQKMFRNVLPHKGLAFRWWNSSVFKKNALM